jgi:hypothetical protein
MKLVSRALLREALQLQMKCMSLAATWIDANSEKPTNSVNGLRRINPRSTHLVRDFDRCAEDAARAALGHDDLGLRRIPRRSRTVWHVP